MRFGLIVACLVLTSCAPAPAPPLPAAPASVEGVTVEPELLARLQHDTGAAVNRGVLVAAKAGEETVVVLAREASEQERAGRGRAASMWIAKGEGPFRRVAEYLSYNFTCRNDDPVCPEVQTSGLGFAAVRKQANGGIYVVVAATGERPVHVTTAEGQTHAVGAVPNGAVVQVNTSEPWQIRIRATLPDGRAYTLMLPPFGVVES